MRNILIADDDLDIHEIFKDYLADHLGEKQVTIVCDGVQALMKCTTEKFDLILLDHKMPRLSGLDLLVALRSSRGLNEDTRIIVISGALPEIENAPEELPNTFFITKPVDFVRFVKLIHLTKE